MFGSGSGVGLVCIDNRNVSWQWYALYWVPSTSQLWLSQKMYRTSGQSNMTKRPHRRRTWTVQSYSPGDANVHPPHVTHASLGLPRSTTKTASGSVQPVLHSSWQSVTECAWHVLSPKNSPFTWSDLNPPFNTWFTGPIWAQNPNGISIGSAVFVA